MREHPRARLAAEDGYTVVEILAAMVIMLVGVLGTFVIIEGGLTSTSRTTAREQGTNVARDLVERTRQAAYTDMTYADAAAKLRLRLPSSEVGTLSGSTFTVTRRSVEYTVTVFACSIDEPTDGVGQGNATYCEAPSPFPGPGDPTPGLAAAVNVLGVQVTAGGSLVDTVCRALGADSTLLASVTSVASTVTPLSACSSSSPAPASGMVAYDSRPDDLRRVRIDVSWTSRGGAGSISQTTLLTNPVQSG